MNRLRRNALVAVTFGASVLASTVHAEGKDPLAAFVVLGQTTEGARFALARAVIDKAEADCPSLEPADGNGDLLKMTPRSNPDPGNFDVTVCEAPYPTRGLTMNILGTAIRLPPVPPTVTHVAVFGDTGCKPDDQNGCKKDKHWPFGEMADSAAESDPTPDLILHMGDYNYRGTPGKIEIAQADGKREKVRVYDAGDNTSSVTCTLNGPYYGQNSVGSDTPDSWKAWKKDFFEPASKLLRTAPWIVARGNHELCSRAGPGFFYFLDPGSNLLPGSGGQQTCPSAEAVEPLIFRPPYRVDLGGLSVVVLDSANACDQGSLHQQHFDLQFRSIQTLVQQAPASNAIWLQSHRPLSGLKKPDEDTPGNKIDPSGKYAVIDQTLQAAFARYPLPRPIHLVLSGHMHRFQALDFEPPNQLPTQLIIGNGGVDLAHNYPKDPFSVDINENTVVGFGLSKFGYMNITLSGGGEWTGRLLSSKGKLIAACASGKPSETGACAPVGD